MQISASEVVFACLDAIIYRRVYRRSSHSYSPDISTVVFSNAYQSSIGQERAICHDLGTYVNAAANQPCSSLVACLRCLRLIEESNNDAEDHDQDAIENRLLDGDDACCRLHYVIDHVDRYSSE